MKKNFAIIENGKVVNIAISETALEPNWVQSDVATIGDDYINGQFVTPAPDTSVQAAQVRAQRNALLSACDWTQLADAPVDDLAWATYRQALRDIPTQSGFPLDVVWPVAPGGA
jgi:hypothetical protein